jgi:hypothetical protein
MICYRDMTFCSAKCATVDCHRNYTDDVHKAALEWSKGFNLDYALVAMSDYSKSCKWFEEPHNGMYL